MNIVDAEGQSQEYPVVDVATDVEVIAANVSFLILTIKEFGYAVVVEANSIWQENLDKNFDPSTEIGSYTLYFINPDRIDLYERKFSQLS